MSLVPVPPSARARVATVTLALLGSCLADHDSRVVPTETLLPWLRPGTTTRAELAAILGAPRRQMESGRIMMWEFDEDGYQPSRPVERPHWAPFSLVVVVGPERVERASLVRVWQ